MCLDYLISKSEIRFPDSGPAFKVVRPIDHVNFHSIYNPIVLWNTWLQRMGTTIPIRPNESYPAGFHVFTKEEDCCEYLNLAGTPQCVVQVQYRGLLAAGLEHGRIVLVTREIYVPSVEVRNRDRYPGVPCFVNMPHSRPKGFWYSQSLPWWIVSSESTTGVPCLYNKEHKTVYLT